MAALQATGISDVLITSLNELGRMKFTDLSSDYQNTIALKRIFKKQKATIESGPEVQFNVMTDVSDSFRSVGLGYISNVNIPNVMTSGKMPWRHVTWNWAMEARLVSMNSGRAKIVDIAQTQRMAALGGAILGFERLLWRCPANTDAGFGTDPVGIPYFVVKSATATSTNDGFNGTAPSGYTLVANINPTTYPRWANYAAPYTSITKDDLVRAMRRAQFYTDWTPLVDGMPTYDTGDDYGIYLNYGTLATIEEMLEAQNENLGNNIASMDGKAMFMRTPLTPVKHLDNDTTGVVYMLNWGELGVQALKDWWMKEQHFPAEANQPTISMTNTDCTFNLTCTNRHKQAVLSTGTTMPA